MKKSISEQDLTYISQSLGKNPKGIIDISCRDSRGNPSVIKVAPFIDDKPFPTLYWLIDPYLKIELGKIEMIGWVKKIENDIISSDLKLKESLKQDHITYQKERIKTFESLGFKKENLNENLFQQIYKTGIAGIRNFETVKCLHTQYAAHLVKSNTVGRILDENFPYLKK